MDNLFLLQKVLGKFDKKHSHLYTKTQRIKKLQLIEVKKSKFYSGAFVVKTKEDCEKILLELQKEHKKATHICYAYSLCNTAKMCDDGEPSGTAGKPILNVIEKKKLQNIMIVVIRYFGGVKLGAGGLVRAYTKAASLATELI